jgi:hypothetical protein
MRNVLLVCVACGALGLAAPSRADDCPYRGSQEERLDGAGVRLVRVHAEAGSLRIEGRAAETGIVARGVACAARESQLDDVRLRAVRSGSTAEVRAEMPADSGWLSGWGGARLDLVIEVPAGVAVEVEDGSGPIHVENVAAATVRDGSGEIVLLRVAGEARITDGSGSIEVRDAGSVVIDEDGSGSISVSAVRGSVTVRDDGSGSIAVRDVGGDFVVEEDGSGSISHDAVRGRVRIPSGR